MKHPFSTTAAMRWALIALTFTAASTISPAAPASKGPRPAQPVTVAKPTLFRTPAAEKPLAPAPEVPALLKESFANSAWNENNWAYTESTLVNVKFGKEGGGAETVFRFDPSKPYEEQYTAIKVDGRAPAEKDIQEYRQKGITRQKEKDKEAAKPKMPQKPGLDEAAEKVDIAKIAIAEETAAAITYSIPLKKGAFQVNGLSPENILLHIRVNKDRRIVENLSLKLTKPLRVKIVAKVKTGAITVDLTPVDPKYPPVLTRIAGDIDASFLFKSFTANFGFTRTEYARVEPYDNRFEVKVSPLKFLDL